MFILLLLLEPRFSNFFSVAPDLELSSLIKGEMERQISVSPAIRNKFKIKKTEIVCTATDSVFKPLATSNNRMDGRLANVFVADEVGALRDNYPIQAMQSSQMNIVNRTGILISTAYDSLENPMTQEVDMAEKAIRGLIDMPKTFALLYRPDEPKEWMTSDKELLKANPIAAEIQDTYDFLVEKRSVAVLAPEDRKNFLTKHMNIFVNGDEEESYIKESDLDECEVDDIQWQGRDVYVGLDLAQTNDNTAVAMTSYDPNTRKIYGKAWAFYPKGLQTAKSQVEKLDYASMSEKGWAFPVGNKIIDYAAVEKFVMELESTYGVHVKGIGYDKWNAVSTAAKLSDAGYEAVEIVQNTAGLYPATKLLREKILNGEFEYETNKLMKLNFLNAKVVLDNNLSYYLNKKKSSGKIDMVAAMVDSLALWETEIVDEGRDMGRMAILI